MTVRDYIARETAISAAINAVLSAGFFLAIFSSVDRAPIWGSGGYAIDFVPQSFMIGLMAWIVPSLLARKGRERLRPGSALSAAHFPGAILRAGAGVALMSAVVGSGTAAAALLASGATSIDFAPALTLKIVYGALLGALVSVVALRRMLR